MARLKAGPVEVRTEENGMKSILSAALLAALAVCPAWAEETDYDHGYVFAAGSAVLPTGGGRLHRTGGVSAAVGFHLSEFTAVEAEAGWHADRAFFGGRFLAHFSVIDEYNRLFGYERIDPFVTLGVCGWTGRGEVGPAFGIGTYYHLSDHWSLRFSAEAVCGVDGEAEFPVTLSAGLRRSF